MHSSPTDWLVALWNVARANDLPNWFAVAFTAVVWPLALLYWHRRRVIGVPGLEVHFFPGKIKVNCTDLAAVDIQFTNHTGSVVYVSGPRIRDCSAAFRVPREAARNIADSSYHLKFMDTAGQFVMREVTLQTSMSAKTCMPAPPILAHDFFTHRVIWLTRLLRRRKYFVLEYAVMVGTTRRLVATRY